MPLRKVFAISGVPISIVVIMYLHPYPLGGKACQLSHALNATTAQGSPKTRVPGQKAFSVYSKEMYLVIPLQNNLLISMENSRRLFDMQLDKVVDIM